MIIKRSESVLAQVSECRLLLGALGEAEQSAKRKAQRCFAPKGVYTVRCTDGIQCLRIDFFKKSLLQREKGDRLRWMRCQGKEFRSENLMKRKQTPHPSYSQMLVCHLPPLGKAWWRENKKRQRSSAAF